MWHRLRSYLRTFVQKSGHTMRTRDRERLRRLRFVIRRLLDHGGLERGSQSRLAEHFGVSRQYIHQLVNEERERLDVAGIAADDGGSALQWSS